MTYRRIEDATDLPAPGPFSKDAREQETLDFKTYADPGRGWEHAKDLAALANRLGGVLLIGADENGGQLSYPGLQGQTGQDVKRIYEQAAEQLCAPSPIVNAIPIRAHGIELVAVNVDPFIDHLVAARARTKDRQGRDIVHQTAWIFPMRVASQTQLISPEKLPMYMNLQVRRAFVLLSRIRVASLGSVTVHSHSVEVRHTPLAGTRWLAPNTYSLADISVEKNAITLERSSGQQCRIPLLDVQDVWESSEGAWDVRVAGHLVAEGSQFKYQPLPL